jgi:2-aminoethylphosphonate dioxygenase
MTRDTLDSPWISTAELYDDSSNGFIILREVFNTDEVAAMASEAQTLIERRELIDVNNIRCRWQGHCETGKCLFDCFDPVIDIGPVARAVARDERILGVMRALFRQDAHPFKDKLIFKPPRAKGYALQDYISWKEFPESCKTVVVAIDSADAASGAIAVFAGYHCEGCVSAREHFAAVSGFRWMKANGIACGHRRSTNNSYFA